jgi:hypothetical protein
MVQEELVAQIGSIEALDKRLFPPSHYLNEKTLKVEMPRP